MNINFLYDVFNEFQEDIAVVWKSEYLTYKLLTEKIAKWKEILLDERIKNGEVVVVEGDFSPNSISLFLALMEINCIIVPLTKMSVAKREEFLEVAQWESVIQLDENDSYKIIKNINKSNHKLYIELRNRNNPGLVLFSSGSTGKSKAALHDLSGILEKFAVRKRKLRTITFLLYDHIGGVNTMLYVLSNGGTIITATSREPDYVLNLIEKEKAELLPTSPTFINLILLSEAYKKYDLSSLKTVTYGTEPMTESTLNRFNELFPNIKLQQTYGLSEIGILRSKSKGSASLWVKVGGEGFETRIVDGLLEVKAQSAMMGYLNAPSPFTEDGWFKTGDMVEVDGEYIKILGRKSEIINVGGEKVYPAEVESVILEIEGVNDVVVSGEKHPITGNIVCARVSVDQKLDQTNLKQKIKIYCKEKLQNYKVPVKITFTIDIIHSDRFKKKRF